MEIKKRRTENVNRGIFNAVYEIVRQIPRGKVATYGMIASILGNVRLSRAVGYALHVNPDNSTIPCHRVVFRDGALSEGYAFGGKEAQRKMLSDEGVTFGKDGKVVMSKHLWKAEED